jgi:hypothetical protein
MKQNNDYFSVDDDDHILNTRPEMMTRKQNQAGYPVDKRYGTTARFRRSFRDIRKFVLHCLSAG